MIFLDELYTYGASGSGVNQENVFFFSSQPSSSLHKSSYNHFSIKKNYLTELSQRTETWDEQVGVARVAEWASGIHLRRI